MSVFMSAARSLVKTVTQEPKQAVECVAGIGSIAIATGIALNALNQKPAQPSQQQAKVELSTWELMTLSGR